MENRQPPRRSPLKSHHLPNWKQKLRENCYKRVREDRRRLLWKMRLPATDQSYNHKEFIKSAMQDILSDELKKIKESTSTSTSNKKMEILTTNPTCESDTLWEYDGLQNSYKGDCEEIMLEMQNIFYEDLREEPTKREPENVVGTWEDEEDEYLARAVFEHMHLKDKQVCKKEIWCPICKQGELQEDHRLIYCTLCELKLNRGDEVHLDLLQTRLAEAQADHFDRGCRLKPKFCIDSSFGLTALYILCDECSTFEVVI